MSATRLVTTIGALLRRASVLRLTSSMASLAAVLVLVNATQGQVEARADSEHALTFLPNLGQWNGEVLYGARAGPLLVGLKEQGLLLRGTSRSSEGNAIQTDVELLFEGAHSDTSLEPEEPQPARYSFFRGSDPSRWCSGVTGYGAVTYRGVLDGVDVRVHGAGGTPTYDLLLSPGASPERIVVRVKGATGLQIATDGSLILHTPVGDLAQRPATCWSVLADGSTVPRPGRYRLLSEDRFGFDVAGHDGDASLIIDPGLEWSTYLGGSLDFELPGDIAQLPSGDIVVVGVTESFDFPTTAGVIDTTCARFFPSDCVDAYLTRFTKDGVLVASTFLGGASGDEASCVTVDDMGMIVISGYTAAPDFPLTPGSPALAGSSDVFVTRLTPDLDAIVNSRLVGGSKGDQVLGMTLAHDGDVVICGYTYSANYPTTPGAYDTTYIGTPGFSTNGFLTRLDSSLATIEFSTYLGGPLGSVTDVAVDAQGAIVFVATLGSSLPPLPGAFQSSPVGVNIARLSSDGSTLLHATYLAGTDGETVNTLALDPLGNVIVAGDTFSDDFPVTPGSFWPFCFSTLGEDGYVASLSPQLSSLNWSGCLSAGLAVNVTDLHVDASGQVTLVGFSIGSSYPTTPGAFDTTKSGVITDTVVTRLSPDGSTILYSTFLGGSGQINGANSADSSSLAVDETGSAYVILGTSSSDYPVTPGAFQPLYAGQGDVAVTKLDMLPTGVSKYGASTPGCLGPLALGVRSMPMLGDTNFALTCSAAPPYAQCGLMAVALQGLSTPLAAVGTSVWVNPSSIILLLGVTASETGWSLAPLPIPSNSQLTGLDVYFQEFWPDPCGSSGWSASNALHVTLQP